MILYRTKNGPVVGVQGNHYPLTEDRWRGLVNRPDLHEVLAAAAESGEPVPPPTENELLPPIALTQELWAAGVTYLRSRSARMDESDAAGGADFYDRVYHADRPELFLKATPHRVVGTGDAMHLRRDSKWIVPEPELTLVVTSTGKIVGYTVGNDLSCRDIEGENPLYLPQAKTFDRCAAIGPGVLISPEPLPDTTAIGITIERAGDTIFEGETNLGQMNKKPPTLVEYLFRDNAFPHGCLLMTGTGVVPPNDFSLQVNDVVRVTIDGIGTLVNTMA